MEFLPFEMLLIPRDCPERQAGEVRGGVIGSFAKLWRPEAPSLTAGQTWAIRNRQGWERSISSVGREALATGRRAVGVVGRFLCVWQRGKTEVEGRESRERLAS